MKNQERKSHGLRMRQFEQLTEAGVGSGLAMAVSNADALATGHKSSAKAQKDGSDRPETLLDAFPNLRNRLSGMADSDRTALVRAAADVLDNPFAASGHKALALAGLVSTCVVLFLFATFVFPTFQNLFESFGAELPVPTLVALLLGQWVLLPVAIILAVILAADQLAARLPPHLAVKLWRIEAAKERLAVLQRQRQVAATRTLALWLAATRGRLGDAEALAGCQELLGRSWMTQRLARVAAALQQGKSLSDALKQEGAWLPGLSLLLADPAVDGAALNAYALSLNARADTTSARQLLFSQLALGVVLGFFVIAMYLPIFKMGAAL